MFGRGFRFRHISRTHVVVLLVVGFLIGYWCVPRLVSEEAALRVVGDPAITFSPSGEEFVVEGKEKRIMSGAVHYFRVVPAYWEDRLKKLKAAGLNTVETYMPWNLHEPMPGQFDFAGILDIARFLSLAQSLGLHVIVRPGPYICSEWDLGGLPLWLLHDPEMVLRSMYEGYLKAVDRYFNKIFDILVPLQSSYGGPIIAFQIENELADYPQELMESQKYMHYLYDLMRELGVNELLFTSDGQGSLSKSVELRPADDVLLTVNFMTDNTGLDDLKDIQPNKPLMVMEFWSGWFDHWGEPHLTRNQEAVELGMKTAAILKKGGSFNYYMFHGQSTRGESRSLQMS